MSGQLIYYIHKKELRSSYRQDITDGAGISSSQAAMSLICNCNERRQELHTELWWRNPTEIGHFKDRGGDGKIILRWVSGKYVMRIGGEWK